MAHAFKISSFGIKLIKAYEGFRPVETTLTSGQRIIGYGHKFHDNDEPAITSAQAETLLLTDLEAYENMVNENIFAPLTQSQFDALVSLSFNIGPKAFLTSTVLHSLNNGQILVAASGFDEWCESDIEGQTYVVDALVRRRTAEKALFLRAEDGVISAPRHELPPKRDVNAHVFDNDIYVPPEPKTHAKPSIELRNAPRQENEIPIAQNVSNDRTDSVDVQGRDVSKTHSDDPQQSKQNLSPIALAAEEVSERLDRLIADNPNTVDLTSNVPDSSKTKPKTNIDNIDDIPKSEKTIKEVIADIKAANEGTRGDYKRPASQTATHTRSPDRFIQKPEKQSISMKETRGFGVYWFVLCIGTLLCASGAAKFLLTPRERLTEMSAFMIPVATIIGAMLMIGSLYYLYKNLSKHPIDGRVN